MSNVLVSKQNGIHFEVPDAARYSQSNDGAVYERYSGEKKQFGGVDVKNGVIVREGNVAEGLAASAPTETNEITQEQKEDLAAQREVLRVNRGPAKKQMDIG